MVIFLPGILIIKDSILFAFLLAVQPKLSSKTKQHICSAGVIVINLIFLSLQSFCCLIPTAPRSLYHSVYKPLEKHHNGTHCVDSMHTLLVKYKSVWESVTNCPTVQLPANPEVQLAMYTLLPILFLKEIDIESISNCVFLMSVTRNCLGVNVEWIIKSLMHFFTLQA